MAPTHLILIPELGAFAAECIETMNADGSGVYALENGRTVAIEHNARGELVTERGQPCTVLPACEGIAA